MAGVTARKFHRGAATVRAGFITHNKKAELLTDVACNYSFPDLGLTQNAKLPVLSNGIIL